MREMLLHGQTQSAQPAGAAWLQESETERQAKLSRAVKTHLTGVLLEATDELLGE